MELNPGGTTPAEVGCVAGGLSGAVVVTAGAVVVSAGSVLAAAQPLTAISTAAPTSEVVRRIGAFIVAGGPTKTKLCNSVITT